MGEDVRVAYPEETGEKAYKRVFKPIFWIAALVLIAIAFFVVPLAFDEGRDTSGIQSPRTATQRLEVPQVQDRDPQQEVPAPSGGTAELPPGSESLPPGTSTLPAGGVGSVTEPTVQPLVGSPRAETSLSESLNTIIYGDPDRFEGERIAVYRGTVQHVVVGRAFALGPTAESYIWVVLPNASNAEQREAWSGLIRPGKRVYVDGVLGRVPPADQARRLFGIQGSPTHEIGKSRLFLNARAVESFQPGA